MSRRKHSDTAGHGPSQRQLRAAELVRHALVDILREGGGRQRHARRTGKQGKTKAGTTAVETGIHTTIFSQIARPVFGPAHFPCHNG